MRMLTETNYHENMRRGWSGGLSDGTPCGKGSMIANTVEVRARLPELIKEYGIRSVCDAGAGDLHWMKYVAWDVDYQPFDLVIRHPDVKPLDITREALPPCDLILCRMVLNHMDPERVTRTLALFRASGRYLFATQHAGADFRFDSPESYNKWNLTMAPFSLGEPLETLPDGPKGHLLSLWRLQ